MLKAFLFAGLVMSSAVGTATPTFAEGSIAASRDGAAGISYNFRRPREADERALRECQGNCRIVERYSHSCAAVASGRRGGYGYAVRDRQGAANRTAIENCRDEGGRECHIVAEGCDD